MRYLALLLLLGACSSTDGTVIAADGGVVDGSADGGAEASSRRSTNGQ